MNLEHQVCSLELAKRLKELGVKQESIFCYTTDYDLEFLPSEIRNYDICIAAFTASELGEMLPFFFIKNGFSWLLSMDIDKHIYYRHEIGGADLYPNDLNHDNETEVNARAKMLIYLLENGLIEND